MVLLDVVAMPDMVGSLIQVDLTDQPTLNNALSRSATSMRLPISPADLAMGPAVHETDDAMDAMFTINVTTLRRVLNGDATFVVERRGSVINVGALGAMRGAPIWG